MNPIRRLTAALTGLVSALLALTTAAPAALASGPGPPPIREKHPPPPYGHWTEPVMGPNRAGYPPISHVRTVVIGGMPGWQIALIAIGAALLAATVAVLLDRARTAAKQSRWPGRATPATPSGASEGQNRPESTTMASRLRTMIAPGLLPHTWQPCIHCQQNPAGFWVSQKRASDELDRSRCDVIAFGSQRTRTESDGLNRGRVCSNPRPCRAWRATGE